MSDFEKFNRERMKNIQVLGSDKAINEMSTSFIKETGPYKYTYNFDWLGLPIIQFPQDIVAIQEIIWKCKPTIIVETGIARGGSLLLSASILHLLNGTGTVIGIDIDIRSHNRHAIENHPLAFRIKLIEGSSVEALTLDLVRNLITPKDRVMVILDSNHTHEHVYKELELYAPLVTKDCYLVVMDTVVDHMPENYFPDRPWGKGNNPKTAVHEYLKQTDRFEIDKNIHNKLLITVAPDGYLKCVK